MLKGTVDELPAVEFLFGIIELFEGLLLLQEFLSASGRYGIVPSPSMTPRPGGTDPTAPSARTGAAGTGPNGPGRSCSAGRAMCASRS